MDGRLVDGQTPYSDENESEGEIRNGLALGSNVGSCVVWGDVVAFK